MTLPPGSVAAKPGNAEHTIGCPRHDSDRCKVDDWCLLRNRGSPGHVPDAPTPMIAGCLSDRVQCASHDRDLAGQSRTGRFPSAADRAADEAVPRSSRIDVSSGVESSAPPVKGHMLQICPQPTMRAEPATRPCGRGNVSAGVQRRGESDRQPTWLSSDTAASNSMEGGFITLDDIVGRHAAARKRAVAWHGFKE